MHLIALCLYCEHGLEPRRITRVLDGVSEGLELRWLEPPRPNGTITVADVLTAQGLEEHRRAVQAWSADVWAAWERHHEAARGWAATALARRRGEG